MPGIWGFPFQLLPGPSSHLSPHSCQDRSELAVPRRWHHHCCVIVPVTNGSSVISFPMLLEHRLHGPAKSPSNLPVS